MLPVLGICTGFQILCEAHLLPGALTRNADLCFVRQDLQLRVENDATRWTGPPARQLDFGPLVNALCVGVMRHGELQVTVACGQATK